MGKLTKLDFAVMMMIVNGVGDVVVGLIEEIMVGDLGAVALEAELEEEEALVGVEVMVEEQGLVVV